MHPFRKLTVWRKAHELTLLVYRASISFERRHLGLASQARRAAHAIPANIAEGSGPVTNPQFAQHLQIAIASARELDYFLQLAFDLGELPASDYAKLEARTTEVVRMLVALRKTVVARVRSKT